MRHCGKLLHPWVGELLRDTMFATVWSLTVGDYAGLMVVAPATAQQLASLRFSRADEAAADRGAVARLHDLGASHTGLVRFFERLNVKHHDLTPAWLSTHPTTEERMARLRGTPDVESPRALLDAAQLRVLQSACRR